MIDVPMLAVDRLTRLFPSNRHDEPPIAAVSAASFTLDQNEMLGIVGPNGAGKTTLIDLLATVLTPTSGSIRLAGADIARDRSIRRRIGYVPSGGRCLYPRLSALDNLRFFAALYGHCGVDGLERSEAVLHLCGASEAAATRADRLSDGFAARVVLARALLHDPVILLLDEPARSIDPISRPKILKLIREFASQPGKAAVMVTHDVNDVFDICDLVAVMRDGCVARIEPVALGSDRSRLRAVVEGHAR